MNEALKPCPFCGGKPEITTRDVEPQGDSWYGGKMETFVLCGCGACLFDGHFHEGFYEAETRAVAAWNARASESPETKRVPLKPTPAMIDVAVSFALCVPISRDYNWSSYMADVYRRMIAAA